MSEDALFMPAVELAARLRAGELDPVEVTDAALARIERIDPRVGAFTFLDADGARAAARAIGPQDPRLLAGVPVAIKDLVPVAGWPATFGSDFVDLVPDHDAHAVARLRAAGCTLVGLTSTPEFGILAVTEPRRFGPTRNPWDLTRSPGGSSGGSAAAVAAGMVAFAHGSDGGGSIRVPAACCGLVGHKPSRGRISHAPDAGDSFLATDGVLARCAADAALALDLLSGYEAGDATWAPPEPGGFLAALAEPAAGLRIAVTTTPPFDTDVDPECSRAVAIAADLLTGLGHEVVEADPQWRAEELRAAFSDVWFALTAHGLSTAERLAGRAARPDDVEPLTWELAQRGGAITASGWLDAVMALQAYTRRVVTSFAGFDVLVTPATARRPPAIGEIDACGPDPIRAFDDGWAFNPFCPPWNATGQPALTLPLALGDDGLPLAVQLVGRPLADGPLLALAAQLEAAADWGERRPEL